MNSNFLERTRTISENYFLNFYFLNGDISLSMYDLDLKLHMCSKHCTVSQIFFKIDSSFFMKF